MPAGLEHATRLHGQHGRYSAHLTDDWEIWGPNGGYLATFALRAAGMEAHIQRPASLYCHFLSSPAFDAVQLDVSVLKRGQRAESFTVAMTQHGKPILHALIKTVADGPGYSHQHLQPPAVAPPTELKTYQQLRAEQPRSPISRPLPRFWENIERRPVEQRTTHEPSAPVLREWTRYRPNPCFDDPFLDAARSLILLDTFGFPAAFQRNRNWDYLAPNLDTSVWFHSYSPSCEWLLIDHECVVADHGLMAVSGRVWDNSGALLATGSAQLCCVPNQQAP